MRIAIAGGHGQIALLLARQLSDRGDEVVSLIRNPGHADEVAATGAHPQVADLEALEADVLARLLTGADAVVFAAGAGPGSSAERKDTVDRAGAVLLADAAVLAGVPRYLLVSAMGIDDAPDSTTDPVWAAYVRAKKAAEDEVGTRDVQLTVLRPGRLTDDAPTGQVHLTEHAAAGAVTRADVAAVLVALLDAPPAAGRVLELVGGQTPVAQAVANLF